MELSVKVNDVFGDDVAYGKMIRRSESAGAEAVGFRPWYDDDLDVVIDAADQTDLDIAYLSGGSPDVDGPEFPLTDPDVRESAVEQLQRAIEVAANADGAFLNVIPGRWHDTIDPAVQHRSIVTALRRVAGQAERADVTLLVEPINSRVDHPGIYLTSSHEGYKITDAVDSPNVRLLYDIYHQQISEGNLICNLREHVDEIAHVHVAGVPGRHEPGSGEIDYPAVLSALADAGYEGYVECEFVPVGDAESAIRDVGAMLETAR